MRNRNVLLSTAALLALGTAGASAQVAYGGGSSLAGPTYTTIMGDTGLASSFSYTTSGSGAAQTAFLSNTLSAFGSTAPTSGTSPDFPNVDFGASDAALTAAQIATFSGLGSTHPLIQIPTIGTPITLPAHIPGLTANGGVNLSNDQVCGIFSGKITNWSAIAGAGTTAPITVVYRADGSGTSFLLTQHLGATCNSGNSNFATTGFAGTTTFTSLFSTVPSNFSGASLSGGVQAKIESTANAIGYLSPDYTRIAPNNAGSTTVPFVLSVQGAQPTVPNTTLALSEATIPGEPSNTTGIPTVTTNPTHWVPTAANPTSGYPIVGYTTLELASCYANSATGASLSAFLNNLYNTPSASNGRTAVTDITSSGFAPLPGVSTGRGVTPTGFGGAVINAFLTSGSTLAFNTASNCSGGR